DCDDLPEPLAYFARRRRTSVLRDAGGQSEQKLGGREVSDGSLMRHVEIRVSRRVPRIASSDIAGQEHSLPGNHDPVEVGRAFQFGEQTSQRMVGRGGLAVIALATEEPQSLGIARYRERAGERLCAGPDLKRGRRKKQELFAKRGTCREQAAPADDQSCMVPLDRSERLRECRFGLARGARGPNRQRP